MAIQIDGASQSAQMQTQLDEFQSQIRRFTRSFRQTDEAFEELVRIYTALTIGDDLGQASAAETLTDSSDSRTVGNVRDQIKAALSFAVAIGEFNEAQANTVLQAVYGNNTESIVTPGEIKGLTDQWV